jgi:arginine/lysine/ornithine decarboxylase
MPGEIITQEMIDYLVMLNRSGAVITGAKDPTLETVQVVGIS